MVESPTEVLRGSDVSLPRTPGPPFSPPQRRSSLAFRARQSALSPTTAHCQQSISPHLHQSNVGKKRAVHSPLAGPTSPSSFSDMQKLIHTAKVNLHRDMFAASSPASTIDSRMQLDHNSPSPHSFNEKCQPEENPQEWDSKTWRYSSAPLSLATAPMDVREPVPSPTLPEIPQHNSCPDSEVEDATEPVSSGFRSPGWRYSRSSIAEAMATALPLSEPDSDEERSSEISILGVNQSSGLDRRMTQLNVSKEHGAPLSGLESPVVAHLRRRSGGTSMEMLPGSPSSRDLYLSPSAEAAANSAKAKRKLLKDKQVDEKDTPGDNLTGLEPTLPSPRAHHPNSMTPCPNPSAHCLDPSFLRRPISTTTSEMLILDREHYDKIPIMPALAVPRATSTGSPIPCIRARARSTTPYQDSYPVPFTSQMVNRSAPMTHEHFEPGWYYTRDTIDPVRPPARTAYSFSTAASKFTGSDQAPDSRIRDSYKTDTLTALARPPNRFRKNGLGAEVAPRGVGRYYQRPPSSIRPSSARTRASSRQTYNSGSDIRFRSSPPRDLGDETFIPLRRKRALDDSFVVREDRYRMAPADRFSAQAQQGDETIETDEQAKELVRMSMFSPNTPEALHYGRYGMRELSPNVQLYRKNAHDHGHLRKKRRPSYWDNDLKEIRESPAGRGGVNSPVSAQASMRAEFDIASVQITEMDVDDD